MAIWGVGSSHAVVGDNVRGFVQQGASIHVTLNASTWKTRGRFLYDIEGSIMKKLRVAGFTVVRDGTKPHDFTLSVMYREDQGEQYTIDSYGTVIHCVFRLRREDSDNLLEFDISESSHNEVSGTAPYLDALQRFQSNPYYFFLGEILQGRVERNLELEEALTFALERDFAAQIEKSHDNDPSTSYQLKNPLHSMETPRELYGPIAVRRAIDEIVKARDDRAVPVLLTLVDYPDIGVRLRAIESIGVFRVVEYRSQMSEIAQTDREPQVRKAAESVLSLLSHPTSIQDH